MASKDKETGTAAPLEDSEKSCPAMEMQGCCPMMGPMIGIPPMAMQQMPMQQMPMQPMVGWPPMAMPGMNCPLAGEMNGMKCGFKNWEEKFQSMSKKIDEIHKMMHDMQKKNR